MPECGVCRAVLDKERIHYGGISCYSCRQFFRRVTTAGEVKTCKWGSKCVVDHWEQRMCQACRYQKCLAAGMKTELVLDPESKKKRFRKLTFNDCDRQRDFERGKQTLWDVSDESSDEDFEFPKVTESQKEDYSNSESILDPETGLVINSTTTTLDVSDESSDEAFEIPKVNESQKEDYSTNESILDPNTGLVMNSIKSMETDTSTEIQNRKWAIKDGDAQILHYVHKKFRKHDKIAELKDSWIANDSIMNIVLHPQSGDGTNLEVFLKKNSNEIGKCQRKSVIVNRKDHGLNNCYEEEEIITIALNIREIENVYVREEENYVLKMANIFNDNWQEVSLGEKVISETIDLCTDDTKQQMSKELFQAVHMQIRERILRFVFSLEDMDSIPAPVQHTLLKRNLGCIQMLTQIISFNINSVEEEMKFIFSESDLSQIRSRAPGYQGVQARDVFKAAPIPEFLKMRLFNLIMSCSHPTLKDPVVFMLMVMIVMFKDPSNVEANHISDQYWTMLKRWLTRKVEEQKEIQMDEGERIDKVENILPALARCINILPIMMEMEPELV